MDENDKSGPQGFFFSRWGVGFLALTAIAGYFLWTEHQAHVKTVVPYLPYLLLLACPLMHLFMHHGHAGHGAHPDKKEHGMPPTKTTDGKHGGRA